ncbi:hypothetical protein F5J12DRAFT_888205 [Pisolithus orientalis]|uniref:uncharacterized protein n=1 Tax=Pisolithus orientalis TaxID=936130 RepID=UPI0022248CF1|nr:uncharacterized protein F5J12DRAFT_888205 [Pisolithus orientalis]KAI6030397.1 hypothetical protein F5J12DRAFT_888205 [Pisolithus orientalis]
MAPQTCSQRALRAASNTSSTDESEIRHAFDNVMKAISPPSHHSDSACSSPLSPSYGVIMGSLLSRVMTPPEDPDSSVDEDEVNQIHKKCQAMINHLSGSDEECQSNASGDSLVNVHGLSLAPSHPPHQDSSQESGAPSVHGIIMCPMARPTTWVMAYQTLGTLWYETWINASILNFHLLSQCGGTHALPDAQEIQFFHQHHLFNSHPADPSVPIAFVVMQNSHFFVAVFDYWLNLAFILGRHIKCIPETPHPYYDPLHHDWNTWNGPFYWTCIASLHGFDAINPTQVDVQMFYLGPPIRLSDHILQVGVPANYKSSHQISDHVTGNYSLALQVPHPSRVDVDDVVILGASQMIEIGSSTSECLMNTFVNGWHKDGHHICLDLELDHKLVTPEELEVTMANDSLIWVMHSLQFNTPLPIYLGPIIEEKAPMHKHNHVYINILVPQSEADSSAIGSHTKWLTMAFPLCGVPHTVFGALSNAAGTMNVYICFPRMIHRDEMMHKHANHIPKEVLDFFWEHVLLPASVHIPMFQGGKTKKAGQPKAVPFSMQVLKQIQKTMEAIIGEDPS